MDVWPRLGWGLGGAGISEGGEAPPLSAMGDYWGAAGLMGQDGVRGGKKDYSLSISRFGATSYSCL